MVRGHTLRLADGKQRLPPRQAEDNQRDQRKRPRSPAGPDDRRGLREAGWQHCRSWPRKSRIPETAGKRRDKPAAKNNCCKDLRTRPGKDRKGRRRNRPPNKEKRGLIANGQVHRTIPTPDQNTTRSKITNKRRRLHRETDL